MMRIKSEENRSKHRKEQKQKKKKCHTPNKQGRQEKEGKKKTGVTHSDTFPACETAKSRNHLLIGFFLDLPRVKLSSCPGIDFLLFNLNPVHTNVLSLPWQEVGVERIMTRARRSSARDYICKGV
ncbi:hypothetical protein OPV22_025566 [Ensete ventricosum]|uniref:Uncharacterized protein n=1 Tax=Ensete ventricosum TaxID=4639 RepID=A0AAV8QCY9_ENSVE|nr:hypothetical protein OPV22_025566 [Ensete ventricosum]